MIKYPQTRSPEIWSHWFSGDKLEVAPEQDQQSPRLKSELADFTIPQDRASVNALSLGLKKVLRTAQSPGREAIQSTADAHAQS